MGIGFFRPLIFGRRTGTSLSIVRPRRQGRPVHTTLGGGQSIRPRTHDRMCSGRTGLPIRNAVMIWRNQIPITDTDNSIPELTIGSDCIYRKPMSALYSFTDYLCIKDQKRNKSIEGILMSTHVGTILAYARSGPSEPKNSFFFCMFPILPGNGKNGPRNIYM